MEAINGRHSSLSSIPLRPTPGAYLTFAELSSHPPQSSVEAAYKPVIHRALRDPPNVNVLHKQSDVPPVFLMRAEGPEQAYALIPGKEPISLNHHGPNWGCVYFACVYPIVPRTTNSSTTVRAPDNKPVYVAIKQLSKSVVQQYLHQGGQENPYKEIALMQELGDNIHVLECMEALEDETYLYIITLKACQEGTLKDFIPWYKPETLSQPLIRDIFRKLLAILVYLEKNHVCHRDLSPDNFLFLRPDTLVVFDLALSVRIPQIMVNNNHNGAEESHHRGSRRQRTLILPQGSFGTRAWQAPELFRDKIYDGVGTDLWSVLVVLYNLSTNQVLYQLPHYSDIAFRYFLLAKGLSNHPVNERTIEVLMELNQPGTSDNRNNRDAQDLLARAMKHLGFGRYLLQLFEHGLAINPGQRFTLANTIESDYVMQDEDI
jgi:serine/threonine protein kinase